MAKVRKGILGVPGLFWEALIFFCFATCCLGLYCLAAYWLSPEGEGIIIAGVALIWGTLIIFCLTRNTYKAQKEVARDKFIDELRKRENEKTGRQMSD